MWQELQMQNELSMDLRGAGVDIRYDAQIKKVLGNKIILAWILCYTVGAFAKFKPEEVVACIEGEPQIGTAPVHAGHEKITGLSTESKEPEEGVVTYDIRFWAYLPGQQEPVKIIINVEAQNNFYPGYAIESRGVFYCGRMISSQLGTEFEIPHYDGLKKVYSIWLCMNAPLYIGNAVAEYVFSKRDIVPGVPDRRGAYDKLSVIMVCLNESAAGGNGLSRMLNTLLSTKISAEEKMRRLEEEHGISMKRELGKEVQLMCNLSELAIEQGRSEGRAEGINFIVERMLERRTVSDEEILSLSGLSALQLQEIKNRRREPHPV